MAPDSRIAIVLLALAGPIVQLGCSPRRGLLDELEAATRSAAQGNVDAYLRHFVSPEQVASLVDCSTALARQFAPETRRTAIDDDVRRTMELIAGARVTFDDIFDYGPPRPFRVGDELSGCRVRRSFTVQKYRVSATLRFRVLLSPTAGPDAVPPEEKQSTTDNIEVWRFDGGTYLWTDPFELVR